MGRGNETSGQVLDRLADLARYGGDNGGAAKAAAAQRGSKAGAAQQGSISSLDRKHQWKRGRRSQARDRPTVRMYQVGSGGELALYLAPE